MWKFHYVTSGNYVTSSDWSIATVTSHKAGNNHGGGVTDSVDTVVENTHFVDV